MWLQLEKGSAKGNRNFLRYNLGDPDPGGPARRALAMEAAHSALPECGVEGLPGIARRELASGLGGPLRRAIAEAEPTEEAIESLRDQLVASLSGQTGHRGALVLTDHIHLSRLVRGDVPAMVAVECLLWYGAYRGDDDPHADQIAWLRRMDEEWWEKQRHRPRLELEMLAVAFSVVGEDPEDLLDKRV